MPLKPNRFDLNWVEDILFLCACMRVEAICLCKHACVCEAGAGRATHREEECQVDCGRGCLAQWTSAAWLQWKVMVKNRAWRTNHHTHFTSHTRAHMRETDEYMKWQTWQTDWLPLQGQAGKWHPHKEGDRQTQTRATPLTPQDCLKILQHWAHNQTNRKTERRREDKNEQLVINCV